MKTKSTFLFGVRLLVLAGTFGIPLATSADTYNFHFPKGKPAEEEEPAQAAPSVSQLAASVPAAGYQAGAPIVINNTNNVGYAPPPPVAATATAAPVATQSLAAAMKEAPSAENLRWHFGVTAILSNAPRGYYATRHNALGGQVTLGYRFTRGIGVNFYGGLREITPSQWHLGADLEALPFRIAYQGIDAFELGFLLGASNALAVTERNVAPHAGLRANVNFGDRFGVTASGRANPDFWMLEAGLITRL